MALKCRPRPCSYFGCEVGGGISGGRNASSTWWNSWRPERLEYRMATMEAARLTATKIATPQVILRY
jgi:hypothetical protein